MNLLERFDREMDHSARIAVSHDTMDFIQSMVHHHGDKWYEIVTGIQSALIVWIGTQMVSRYGNEEALLDIPRHVHCTYMLDRSFLGAVAVSKAYFTKNAKERAKKVADSLLDRVMRRV